MSSENDLLAQPESDGDVGYKRAVVSFIDILGFKSLVEKSPAATIAASLRKLQDSMNTSEFERSRKLKRPRLIDPPKVFAFSDNVVRVRNFKDDADFSNVFMQEMAELCLIQSSLAQAGVFVRGGITTRSIYSDSSMIFGPGLVRAYGIENSLAVSPRIVIDPETIAQFRNRPDVSIWLMRREISFIRKSIKQSDDGLWFIDYLGSTVAAIASDTASRRHLIAHRSAIVSAAKNLPSDSPALPKYLWLATYHNAVCERRFGTLKDSRASISKTQLPAFERLLMPRRPTS